MHTSGLSERTRNCTSNLRSAADKETTEIQTSFRWIRYLPVSLLLSRTLFRQGSFSGDKNIFMYTRISALTSLMSYWASAAALLLTEEFCWG